MDAENFAYQINTYIYKIYKIHTLKWIGSRQFWRIVRGSAAFIKKISSVY